MTKKSLARQERDRLKKEMGGNTSATVSTLWTDIKNISKLCWEMLSQNRLLLETLKSDLTRYIPSEEIGTLNSSLATLTSDVLRFKEQLETIDAKHNNYQDTKEPIEDTQEIYAMFALAVECQAQYQQFIEQYNAVVMPVTNRVIEIIALAEDKRAEELSQANVDISAVRAQPEIEDAVIVETSTTSSVQQ